MRDDGFTLLEILVVTVVFGLLSVALWEGIGVGTHGWAMAEHRHYDEVTGQGIEDALRRLIERADVPDNGGVGKFSGQGDRLRVIAWLPEKNGYEKEVEAAFGVDAQHELIVRWQPYRRATCPEQPEALHEEILARGISAIDFSYYGLQGGRHVWQPTWNSSYLPLLVRVQVRFLAPGRSWPTMMIRPLLSGAEAR